jgi:hypothetical protein
MASVTRKAADALIEAALQASHDMGFDAAVAVTDATGNLRAFQCADGAPFPAVSLVPSNPAASHHHTAGDARALAQSRISLLLALEVAPTGRVTADRHRTARIDPENRRLDRIVFKDWGTGQPIVFHHGWPLSADKWDIPYDLT